MSKIITFTDKAKFHSKLTELYLGQTYTHHFQQTPRGTVWYHKATGFSVAAWHIDMGSGFITVQEKDCE